MKIVVTERHVAVAHIRLLKSSLIWSYTVCSEAVSPLTSYRLMMIEFRLLFFTLSNFLSGSCLSA